MSFQSTLHRYWAARPEPTIPALESPLWSRYKPGATYVPQLLPPQVADVLQRRLADNRSPHPSKIQLLECIMQGVDPATVSARRNLSAELDTSCLIPDPSGFPDDAVVVDNLFEPVSLDSDDDGGWYTYRTVIDLTV